MTGAQDNPISRTITVFRGRSLPEPDTRMAGYGALVDRYDLHVPLPEEASVKREPAGRYARRTWFFYEWLMGEKLTLPDATTGNYVDALDVRHNH